MRDSEGERALSAFLYTILFYLIAWSGYHWLKFDDAINFHIGFWPFVGGFWLLSSLGLTIGSSVYNGKHFARYQKGLEDKA